MTQRKETEITEQIIKDILDKIRKQYFTDECVLPLVLCNDKKQVDNLQKVDALYQSVQTSLQFRQYRRAVWYLQALSLICTQTFGENINKIMNNLHQ